MSCARLLHVGDRRRGPISTREAVKPACSAVLLVGNDRDWPPELTATLSAQGYATGSVPGISALTPHLLAGGVGALFVLARPLGASEVLALRHVREASPGTAIVVVTKTATDPDLKRAFESGATTFLSWPASPETLRQAIGSGAVPALSRQRPRS